MYIPRHFLQTDVPVLIEFMQRYSFATLVSQVQGRPFATHIPVLTEMRDDKIVLCAHISKANPQWQEISGQEVLVIFSEPHAYISPQHYEKVENVPTWNYIAVHAYGQVRWVEHPDAVINLLEKTIMAYEKAYFEQWRQLSDDYKSRMARGIVAFEIAVTEVQGKEKLSQNKTDQERRNIAASLDQSPHDTERALAEWMRR